MAKRKTIVDTSLNDRDYVVYTPDNIPHSHVVTIEVVYESPVECRADTRQAVRYVLDDLNSFGCARVIRDDLVHGSFEHNCEILRRKAVLF